MEYYPCFGEYQCTRLEVPLDWNETTPGTRAAIAIIRIPAQVHVTDPRYGGAILTNPGGPGESGVGHVLTQGKKFQAIADGRAVESTTLDSSSKSFDWIGFDPRGVNNTTPLLECFPEGMARQVWDAQVSAEGFFGSSDQSFNNMWARSQALGQACADNGTGIAQHMNTPPVVADMVAIIEAHGSWREQEAKSLLAMDVTTEQKLTVLERTRWKKGEEQLLYWGFSYGSILGQTFATLQPGRVSRAVMDGVADIGDYYRGDWLKNLQVTDRIVDKFCEYCHLAGPSKCDFFTGSSSEDIKKRLDNLLATLKENPVFTSPTDSHSPEIFTCSDFMAEFEESLYNPVLFPDIATLLAALADPSTSKSSSIISGYKSSASYRSAALPTDDGNTIPPRGIRCSDSPDFTTENKSVSLLHAQTIVGQSKYMGANWVPLRMDCVGWASRPKWGFDYTTAGGKTKEPMLFVGNTLDPVTPVLNARNMAAMWEGSGVAELNGEGHCTYAANSTCMNGVIGRYFQTGELPAPGTVCKVDRRPFEELK